MATYGSYKKIDSQAIIDGVITSSKFSAGAVDENKFVNLSVSTDKFGNDAVTNTKFGNGAVGTTEIANSIDLSGKTVTYRPISNPDVGTGAAISTGKIDGAVGSIPGNALAASATTDTTNASNINSGSLPFAQGGMGTEAGFKMQRLNQLTGGGQQITTWGVNSHQGAGDFRTGESGNTYAWTSNHTVTVYQAGTYICLVELIPYQNSGQIDIFVRKNGSNITDFRGGSSISNHCACSGRLMLNLNANDYIQIYSTADNGSHHGYYYSWSFAKLGGWS